MSHSNHHSKSSIILPHQQNHFDRLCAIARAEFRDDKNHLPIKIRTNSLVIGPSGSGKSHIVKLLAESLEVPLFRIASSEWMILGGNGKGTNFTWPAIFRFLSEHHERQGKIIFVDEIDKICGISDYTNYLRTEIFMLLDKSIPENLKEDILLELDSHADALKIARKSFEQTLIIAAGAFQMVWDEQSSKSLGFNSQTTIPKLPDLGDLAKFLPKEIINRFGKNLIVLPPMNYEDYQSMMECLTQAMPIDLRQKFHDAANRNLTEAVRLQLGPRYFEEVMLEVMLSEPIPIKIPGGEPKHIENDEPHVEFENREDDGIDFSM